MQYSHSFSCEYFVGSQEWLWERIVEIYNETKDASDAHRDNDSIRKKWNALKYSTSRTGNISPCIMRAKTLAVELREAAEITKWALVARAKRIAKMIAEGRNCDAGEIESRTNDSSSAEQAAFN